VLVSGLELGGRDEHLFSLQLLVDTITGQLGDGDQQLASSRIVQVIVAGNSLSHSTQDRDSLSKVGIY
jgi:DNA polymerase delta subunit 2